MTSNLLIPAKINVGFQNRHGTFTGKLAYVIYYDHKGVLRKETSWQSWRDSKIEPVEFENIPRSGYLFNKGIQRHGYHWGKGRSVIRVYDPRDFEFEITVDNLIGILMHSDVTKRDIVEECVFAWDGPELVLLPVNSEDYQASLMYTKGIAQNFSARSLVKGYTYNQKRSQDVLTYLGYVEWFDWEYASPSRVHKSKGKKHVFVDPSGNFVTPSMQTLSGVNGEEVVDNYAALMDAFFKTCHSQPIKGVKVVPEIDRKEKLAWGYFFSVFKLEVDGILMQRTIEFRETNSDASYFTGHGSRTRYHFSFEDRETKQASEYTHSAFLCRPQYDYRTGKFLPEPPDTFKKEMIQKAASLGYDAYTLTIEQVMEVYEAMGWGKIAFVLENDCDIYTGHI